MTNLNELADVDKIVTDYRLLIKDLSVKVKNGIDTNVRDVKLLKNNLIMKLLE